MIMNFLETLNGEQVNIDQARRVVITSELASRLMIAIREGKIPLVMDESDVRISFGKGLPNSKDYDENVFLTLNDLVAAHVTPVPPEEDVIKTKESSGVRNNMTFLDPSTGIAHSVSYPIGNDTIHFTLNCVVHNHESGNDWDSYKYGVLIDFEKLDKEKVLDVKGEDTYIDGDAELGTGYFLFCPFGEREEMEKKNPGAIVVEYKDISLATAMSCMIVYSGRKLEPYGTYGWGRNFEYANEVPDVLDMERLVSQEGYPVLKGNFGNALHSETKYMARRMWKREYEALINLIQYNQENGIEMPDEVILPIMVYGGAYSLPGTVPVTKEDYMEVVFPILKKYGYAVDESLFDGVEIDRETKMIYYSPDSSGLPVIDCPNWENTIRDRVINVLKSSKTNDNDNSGKTI